VTDVSPPSGFDILILDAASRQSLASARSLGRAGLRVALGECFAECDPDLPVLAFRSRYSAHNVVFPSFASDAVAFADAVVEFVREHPTRVLLAGSDGSISALTPRRSDLAGLGCVLALAPNDVLEVANDKDRTLDVANRLGLDHPLTLRVRTTADLEQVQAELGFPFVLKPSVSWAGLSTNRLQATEVVDPAEAALVAERYRLAGAGILAQQWVPGSREGVTLFVVDGEIAGSFAHLEHRTTPALGGASVLRESLAMPSDIYDMSVRLVKALGLEGLSEVEFRRDESGRPLLMEINARLAGPIEIAMKAGIDFPLMVWQWSMNHKVPVTASYRCGLRMRWLRGDMRWLRDNHRRAGRPDSVPRLRALLIFGAEFLRTFRYDSFDWRDLGPVVAEIKTTAAAPRRSRRSHQPTDVGHEGALNAN
jgi:predicted ATP-grasp superfamily ATP-dependent carboligase